MPPKQSHKSQIIKKLLAFRDEMASRTRQEKFRVLKYETIEAIANVMPKNLDELAKIKGIGEKKLGQYGKLILKVIFGDEFEEQEVKEEAGKKRPVLSVSAFLNYINEILEDKCQDIYIQGEISGLSQHPSGVYFALKDGKDESVLNCYLSPGLYYDLGIELEDGMEVKVSGTPNIWKPKGKFSLVVYTLELIGEGSLKKAYELIKEKLEKEGLFIRKRPLPEFIKKVGVITSRTGAVIHDFRQNLASLGFYIYLYDTRVEGKKAAGEIRQAIKWFNNRPSDLDVLVIIRGGGSLEDLQAFNNELVGREIFASRIPTICGIGHERDVPIASLVADQMTSTPTAAALLINNSWQRLEDELPLRQNEILHAFEKMIYTQNLTLEKTTEKLMNYLNQIMAKYNNLIMRFKQGWQTTESKIKAAEKRYKDLARLIGQVFADLLFKTKDKIEAKKRYLDGVSPERNLKLGYSIVRKKDGRVIKNVNDIALGEKLITKLYKGEFKSQVKDIKS